MNYEAAYLVKLEGIVTAMGGVVPPMTTPTSFEARSLQLLDAISAASGGGGGGVNPYTESAETTYESSSTVTIAHGLGVVPKDWRVVYRCKTAEAGYSVGDEINADTWFWSSGVYGAQAAVDATNVVLTVTAIPRLLHKTTRLIEPQNKDNWRVVARWR
jgi:hypothetical protein